MSPISSSGITAPSVSAQRRFSSVMPLRAPRLTNSFTWPFSAARRPLLSCPALELVAAARARRCRRSASAFPSRSRRRGRGACSIRSSGGSHSPIDRLRLALDHADLVALLRGDESDRPACAPDPARAPDAVNVDLGVVRKVVVDDVGDVLDVEPTGGDVGRDQQRHPALLELDHHAVSLALAHVAVQRLVAKALVAKLAVEARGADLRPAEDDRLLGLLGPQHLDQALGLVAGSTSTKACSIASTVSCFGVTLTVTGSYMYASARRAIGVGHRRREQRRLAARRAHAKDLLDLLDEAEVEHLVGLVEDDIASRGQHQRAARDQVHHPPDGGDDDMGALAQSRLLGLDRRTAEDGDDLDIQVLGVGAQGLGDLDAELAGRRHHDRLGLLRGRVEVLQQRQAEGRGLARARLRLADHVLTAEQGGDRLLLDRGRLGIAELVERGLDLRAQSELVKGRH